MSGEPILNVSAYKFVPLAALPQWREQVQQQALAHGLKGTVLLAEEGINLFLAGPAQPVRAMLAWLRGQPGLHDLEAKESWSRTVPFRHLRVKVKREIIRMNHPAIQPAAGRAAGVDAGTLARWLAAGHDDAGRPVVMLDTRNAFEVDHGRFDGAIDWRIEKFSDFPAAAMAHREQLAGKTVVSYCTGGIRCEKATLVLRELGLDSVYQLDGGILKYLERLPGAPHWQGQCFVFDGREALDEHLAPARSGTEPAGQSADARHASVTSKSVLRCKNRKLIDTSIGYASLTGASRAYNCAQGSPRAFIDARAGRPCQQDQQPAGARTADGTARAARTDEPAAPARSPARGQALHD